MRKIILIIIILAMTMFLYGCQQTETPPREEVTATVTRIESGFWSTYFVATLDCGERIIVNSDQGSRVNFRLVTVGDEIIVVRGTRHSDGRTRSNTDFTFIDLVQ